MNNKYEPLTKYLGSFDQMYRTGDWLVDAKKKGITEEPGWIPFVSYNDQVASFVKDFYEFADQHPELGFKNYIAVLEENSIELSNRGISEIDEYSYDDRCVLALIMTVIRQDRFSENLLYWAFKEGLINRWLKRLAAGD